MPHPRRNPARLLASAAVATGSLVAALVVSLAVTVGVAAPAEARTAAGTYAHRAHQVTNAQRVAVGLEALAEDRCVKRAAVRQAKAMAAATEMYHQDIAPLLLECGLTLVGENVAYGYRTGRSVVLDGWMRSAGHKANILNPAFTVMGVAARKGGDGRWYVAQVFGLKLDL